MHSTITDGLFRPGLRERFMFSPHSYCSNAFWRNHNAHMKLLWQYDFRDCYTVNRHTGVYQLSYAFEERVADINAWTMGADFFKRWPELYGDIPSFETNAMPMDNISTSRSRGFRSRPALPAPPVMVVEEVEEDEPSSAATQGSTLGLKEEHPAGHAPLYAYPPATMQPGVFGAAPGNAVHGNGQWYLAHENGGLHTDPSHMPRTWGMRNTDAIPEQGWLWFAGGPVPELPEPA
jgi:hypothetical protein